MAGLWSRTTTVVKAKYSKLLNRAENPTETLDYSYEQMLQQLQNVKRGTADVVTSKKRLELQQQKLEQNVVKLETQARQAVAANREDLARQALERKAIAQTQLQDMDGQVKQLEDQQEKLVGGPAAARDADRVLPLAEGSPQGAVLGRGGPGQGRRGRDRDRPAHAGHRAGHPAREGQDRGDAGARRRRSTSSRRPARSRTSPQATRRSSTASSRRSRPPRRSTTSSRSSRRRSAPASPRRRSRPAANSPPAPDAEPAAQPAEETTES